MSQHNVNDLNALYLDFMFDLNNSETLWQILNGLMPQEALVGALVNVVKTDLFYSFCESTDLVDYLDKSPRESCFLFLSAIELAGNQNSEKSSYYRQCYASLIKHHGKAESVTDARLFECLANQKDWSRFVDELKFRVSKFDYVFADFLEFSMNSMRNSGDICEWMKYCPTNTFKFWVYEQAIPDLLKYQENSFLYFANDQVLKHDGHEDHVVFVSIMADKCENIDSAFGEKDTAFKFIYDIFYTYVSNSLVFDETVVGLLDCLVQKHVLNNPDFQLDLTSPLARSMHKWVTVLVESESYEMDTKISLSTLVSPSCWVRQEMREKAVLGLFIDLAKDSLDFKKMIDLRLSQLSLDSPSDVELICGAVNTPQRLAICEKTFSRSALLRKGNAAMKRLIVDSDLSQFEI